MARPAKGVGTPGSSRTRRTLPRSSKTLRKVALALFSPNPNGVSSGPLSTTLLRRVESMVSRDAGGIVGAEDLAPRLALRPRELHPGGVDGPHGAAHHLGADSVAVDDRAPPRSGRQLFSSVGRRAGVVARPLRGPGFADRTLLVMC